MSLVGGEKSSDLAIVLIMTLVGMLIFGIILHGSIEYSKQIDKCNAIPSCKKYKCLAENDILKVDTTNHLLQYQACLLEEDR